MRLKVETSTFFKLEINLPEYQLVNNVLYQDTKMKFILLFNALLLLCIFAVWYAAYSERCKKYKIIYFYPTLRIPCVSRSKYA